jgi:hypothetical protein
LTAMYSIAIPVLIIVFQFSGANLVSFLKQLQYSTIGSTCKRDRMYSTVSEIPKSPALFKFELVRVLRTSVLFTTWPDEEVYSRLSGGLANLQLLSHQGYSSNPYPGDQQLWH